MTILNKIKNKLDKLLFYILFAVIAAMLFCVTLQVFSRYLLKAPVVFTEELVRFLLIWLGMLGGAYTFGKKGHIALTLVLDKIKSNKIKVIVNILIDIIVLFLSIFVLIIGGIKLISVTHNQVSSVMLIPIWWVYIVTPISGFIISFYQIYFIYRSLLNIKETK